jgi:molecular chaperone DnaJ
MAKRDYYEVLGVNRNASADELKSAFRNLARQLHPDVNKAADAEENFKEINEAYAVLSDTEKRAAYDRYGMAGLQGMGGMPDFSSVDFSDIFGEIFGASFGFGGGGFGRSQNMPRRGADLNYALHLAFEETVSGVDREIDMVRDEACTNCRGTGAEPGSNPVRCQTCAGRGEVRTVRQSILGSMVQVATCPTCNGRGEVISSPCRVCRGRGLERRTSKKVVSIPAGVDNGTRIRLSGEGQPGVNGGPHGSLYIDIEVKAHKFFRRKQDEVILPLNINLAQATLGAEIEVPTVDGKEKLKIPAGTQPGKVFTLKGKGIPHLRSSGRGDQLVVVNIEIPTRLSGEQRKLMEELAKTLGAEVKPQERTLFDMLKEVIGG